MVVTGLVPFKYLLYSALLSDVVRYQDDSDETCHGIFNDTLESVYERFNEWGEEVEDSLNVLAEEGVLSVDYDKGIIFLGEYRGRRFFPYEVKTSLFDKVSKVLDDAIKGYGKSKSAKDRSRSRYIREQVNRLIEHGIERMTPGDFTELHGFLYEVYTGGSIYNIRNQVEYYQTANILKAYDKFTTFAILVDGVLNYDEYHRKGVPTLTNVAMMKDEIVHSLTTGNTKTKEYMRDIDSAISEDEDF